MMLHTACKVLTPTDIAHIHDTSMQLLADVGVVFLDDEALDLFRRLDAQVNGRTVRLTEKQVMDAVAHAPSRFVIRARDPAKSITVGGGTPLFVPGYGAPFILDENGRRQPTLCDYENLIRLADALPNQDMSGYLLVQPADLAACQAPPHLLYANMRCSSKPFMGSAWGREGAEHTMAMAGILFDEPADALAERPVTLGLIDTLSPLQYSAEISAALVAYARRRQPMIVASLIMAGATGPITLAGVLAQQNAEILAGITLAQLLSPGTPVIYGSASTMMEMRTGTLAIGSPEMALLVTASAQLARHYGLPSRGGGGLTDANVVDAQAGLESMLGLLTAVHSGIDLILHAAGILSSYLALSYDKFVLDDEICGLVRHTQRGVVVSAETLAQAVITTVGPGGNFLEQDHTVEHCRTAAWQPDLVARQGIEEWLAGDRHDTVQRARQRWQRLLANHEPPPLDATTERQLQRYVAQNGC